MLCLLRFILLLLTVALPLLARAQFARQYAAGSYVLRKDSTVRLTGQLCLKKQQKLLIITPTGRKLRLKPAKVGSFRIGPRHYAVVGDFLVKDKDIRAAFAERLDSGQATLFRYTHLWNTGADWLYLYRYLISFYLVYELGQNVEQVYDSYDPAQFRLAAGRVLYRRPDLLQLLQEGRITYQNFPTTFHALNSGKPFVP